MTVYKNIYINSNPYVFLSTMFHVSLPQMIDTVLFKAMWTISKFIFGHSWPIMILDA